MTGEACVPCSGRQPTGTRPPRSCRAQTPVSPGPAYVTPVPDPAARRTLRGRRPADRPTPTGTARPPSPGRAAPTGPCPTRSAGPPTPGTPAPSGRPTHRRHHPWTRRTTGPPPPAPSGRTRCGSSSRNRDVHPALVPVFAVADTRRRETSCKGKFGHAWHDLSATAKQPLPTRHAFTAGFVRGLLREQDVTADTARTSPRRSRRRSRRLRPGPRSRPTPRCRFRAASRSGCSRGVPGCSSTI